MPPFVWEVKMLDTSIIRDKLVRLNKVKAMGARALTHSAIGHETLPECTWWLRLSRVQIDCFWNARVLMSTVWTSCAYYITEIFKNSYKILEITLLTTPIKRICNCFIKSAEQKISRKYPLYSWNYTVADIIGQWRWVRVHLGPTNKTRSWENSAKRLAWSPFRSIE